MTARLWWIWLMLPLQLLWLKLKFALYGAPALEERPSRDQDERPDEDARIEVRDLTEASRSARV